MEGWRKHMLTLFRWIGAPAFAALLLISAGVFGSTLIAALKDILVRLNNLFGKEVAFFEGQGFYHGAVFTILFVAILLASLRISFSKKLLLRMLPRKSEMEKKRIDAFWKDHAYTVMQTLIVLGLGIFAGVALMAPDSLLELSYFLAFIAASVAATIATWRGRQFENQLQDSRLEQALEMATEKDNDARNFLGFDLLAEMQSFFSLHEYPYLREVFLSKLRIDKRKKSAFDDLYHKMLVGEYAFREVEEFADIFPNKSTMQFILRSLTQNDSPNAPGERHPLYAGKDMIVWTTASSFDDEGIALPHVELRDVAYVLPPLKRGGENYSLPRELVEVKQQNCFYYQNVVSDTVLRRVDFSFSMLIDLLFLNSDLEYADFNYCVLRGTWFHSETRLRGASFKKASISNCKFDEAQGIEPSQFKESFWVGEKSDVGKRAPASAAPEFPESWQEEDFWKGKDWSSLDEFLLSIRRDPPRSRFSSLAQAGDGNDDFLDQPPPPPEEGGE